MEINIYLKEEAQEYLEEDKLKELVGKYSEFINFPIYIWSSKEVSEEVPVEDDDVEDDDDESFSVEDDDADEETDDDAEDDEEDDEEDDTPKTKTVTSTVWDWELANDQKAIWLRSSTEVDSEEYEKFYRRCPRTTRLPDVHPLQGGGRRGVQVHPIRPRARAPRHVRQLLQQGCGAQAVRPPRVHLGRVRRAPPQVPPSSRASSTPIPCP